MSYRSIRAPSGGFHAYRLNEPQLTAADAPAAELTPLATYRVMWWFSVAWLAASVYIGVADGSLNSAFLNSDHTPLDAPYWCINTLSWYRGPHTFSTIATNGFDTRKIRERFGKPQSTAHCGEVELYIYGGARRRRMQATLEHDIDQFLSAHL